MEDEIPSGSKFVGGARLSRHSKTSKKITIQTMLMKYFIKKRKFPQEQSEKMGLNYTDPLKPPPTG